MTTTTTSGDVPRIFRPRQTIKPYEYPSVIGFSNAIRESYWTVDHFAGQFLKDVHDYRVELSNHEKSAIKRALLAISQVEVKVKVFWGDLYRMFPKPEFAVVGACFADCEGRHMETYSHLLELLDLNSEFDTLLEVPSMSKRVSYISDAMAFSSSLDRQQYMVTLALFSLFIENVSLFSQFAVIKSFSKHRSLLRGVDNAVQATQKEEVLHAQFGTHLINLVREECPSWFGPEFYSRLKSASIVSYDTEEEILDWMFEEGDLEFLSRASLTSLLKSRINESVGDIGGGIVFEDVGDLGDLKWFDEEIKAAVNPDLFHKKSVNYSKTKASAKDLF